MVPAAAGAPDWSAAGAVRAGAAGSASAATVPASVALEGLPAFATAIAARAVAGDRCGSASLCSGASTCHAVAPARFAVAAGYAAHAAAHAFRSAPFATAPRPRRAMCAGQIQMVWRCAVPGVPSWPVAAAVRHDGSRVVALQRAVRLVAVARRSAGLHAEPWLDVAARESTERRCGGSRHGRRRRRTGHHGRRRWTGHGRWCCRTCCRRSRAPWAVTSSRLRGRAGAHRDRGDTKKKRCNAGNARKHDLNSFVLRRPEMPTRERGDRSTFAFDLHCGVATQVQFVYGASRPGTARSKIRGSAPGHHGPVRQRVHNPESARGSARLRLCP